MEFASCHYYWRERFYCTMGLIATKSQVPECSLCYGLSLVFQDKTSEALSHFQSLNSSTDLIQASTVASLYAHNQCQVVDRSAVSDLEDKLREMKKRSTSKDLYYTALMYYLTGNNNKALETVEKHLKMEKENSAPGFSLLGWIYLKMNKNKGAVKAFADAMSQDSSWVDGVLGQTRTVEVGKAIGLVNQIIVNHPRAPLVLVEKMRLQLSVRDWEQAADTAARVISLSPDNVPALTLRAFRFIVEGKYDDGATAFRRVITELGRQEPKAWWLLMEVSKAAARICGRSEAVLNETTAAVKHAAQLAPHIMDPVLELGHQYYMASDLVEADNYFKAASKIDDSSISPLAGRTMVQLLQGPITPQVRQQMEFLMEVEGRGDGKDSALILWMKAQFEPSESVQLLDRAVASLQTRSSLFPYGVDHLAELNPDLLLRIANSYPPTKEGSAKSLAVFGLVSESVSGLVEAGLGLARAQMANLDLDAAQSTLSNITSSIDPMNPQAHLLKAQLLIDKGEILEAETSLERGLSYNLEVKELPHYHFLKGLIYLHRKDLASAKDSFQQTLKLNRESRNKLRQRELGRVYEELASVLMEGGDLKVAANVLEEATKSVRGDEGEGRVLLAKAQLACLRGDPKSALTILSELGPGHPHHLQAQRKRAEIFLHHLKDEEAYVDCFKKLTNASPTPENLISLGDAYLNIQEPELAIECYEKAMMGNNGDPKLACRLARVLVNCHQYAKAIKCYRESGEEGSIELAELLLKLGQTDKASTTLDDVPPSQKAIILAKVQEKSGDIEKAMRILQSAYHEYGRSNPDLSFKLCQQMAIYSSMMRDFDTAIEFYKKALSYQPNEPAIQIALAKLYMQVSDWNGCQSLCSSLLSQDPNNEAALLMLADLSFRRVDFSQAATHFASLLTRRPTYWVALARLVEVLRRSARIQEALPFLEAARLSSPNHPGLAYCTGLYHWYSGNKTYAIQNFNLARGDPEWGAQAIHNMVEACLGQTVAAQRLLAEVKPQTPDEEAGLLLLSSFVRLYSEDKTQIERAMIDLTHLANSHSLRVGATLGLATGYVLQKQAARARNVLKRVSKSGWHFEEAEHLEKCWLMLADLYIQAGKQDMAGDLLRKVITHNRSSTKAYELLGLVAEKEHRYLEASEHYAEAWRLSGESDPSLGYKLAFNLLKEKRYADVIEACRTVLRLSPDYPKIKKELMDKAIAHLRT